MVSEATTSAVNEGDILAGKYRVERVLGAGGMGVVVQAEHVELAEKVAIKFLLDHVDLKSEMAERFLREARAAVQIKSEHVARVIDVGRLENGAPFMVMEYLQGSDLSDYVKEKGLSVQDAVDYLIQACEAMSIAHRAGIVHRDLKPANLYRAKRPDGSVVIKVLDFGISKVAQQDTSQAALTQTTAMMGSPLYMAPEQMRSTKNADARSDIWSLGVILYEFLAGSTPFTADSMGELFARVMMEPHVPLTQRRPELPAALGEVVDRCLQKDPAHRYQSVEQLAVSLAPFASARSAVLVARLRDTLTGVAGGPTNPPPSPVLAHQSLAATDVETINIMPVEAGSSQAVGAETNTTWEGSRGGSPAKGSRRAIALGALAIVAVVGVGVAVWRSGAAVESEVNQTSAASPGPQPAPALPAAPVEKPASKPTPGGSKSSTPADTKIEPAVEKAEAPEPAGETAPKPQLSRPAKPMRTAPALPRSEQQRSTEPKPKPKPKPKKPTANNPLSIEFK